MARGDNRDEWDLDVHYPVEHIRLHMILFIEDNEKPSWFRWEDPDIQATLRDLKSAVQARLVEKETPAREVEV